MENLSVCMRCVFVFLSMANFFSRHFVPNIKCWGFFSTYFWSSQCIKEVIYRFFVIFFFINGIPPGKCTKTVLFFLIVVTRLKIFVKACDFHRILTKAFFFNDGQFFNTFRQFFVYMSMKILNITAFLNTINKTLLGFAFRFQWFFIAYWYKLDSPSQIPKLQTNNNGPRTVQVCVSVLLRFVLRCVLFSDIIHVFFFRFMLLFRDAIRVFVVNRFPSDYFSEIQTFQRNRHNVIIALASRDFNLLRIVINFTSGNRTTY